jgi:hypothetical protein
MANEYNSFSPFSVLRKKRVRPLSPILQKNHSFGEYFRLKPTEFIASKHLKVFNTSVNT